jgi:hypothetical protein
LDSEPPVDASSVVVDSEVLLLLLLELPPQAATKSAIATQRATANRSFTGPGI